MRELKNTKIIAVDHGYGNMKTANTVTPTGIKAYETEPIFTGNILEYNGIYYRIGEGHKEFIPDKAMDEEYYLLTLMAIARELNVFSIREADVHLAATHSSHMDQKSKRSFSFLSAPESRSPLPFQRQRVSSPLCGMQPLPTGVSGYRKPTRKFQGNQSPCRYRKRNHEHSVCQQ